MSATARVPQRAAALVALFAASMPFLVGLPRGTGVPLLRPSDLVQVIVTVAAIALTFIALYEGRRWRLQTMATDRWLLAVVAAGAALPLVWLLARARPVGIDDALAALPFVKYAGLFLLVRAAVRTEADLRLVWRATVGAAVVVAAITLSQSLGVQPVLDVLGRYFVSSNADVVDAGRGTSTIGSSIATGSYLAMACAAALSWAFTSGQRRWYGVATLLGVGALASGQAGTVVALGTVLVVLGRLHRRTRALVTRGLPLAAIAVVGLWPIVAARLADLDRSSGLPESWIIRWTNITKLYWPDLADGGWLLGVEPDATMAPPDVWRDIVYLESGYLWLLWVGGVPLLAAAVGFLRAAYCDLGRSGPHGKPDAAPPDRSLIGSVRLAGRAIVVMLAVLSIFDPHLTLRAGADVFFVVLALGLIGSPVAEPVTPAHERWRDLLGSNPAGQAARHVRLQIAEVARPTLGGRSAPNAAHQRGPAEPTIAVEARLVGHTLGRAELQLVRRGTDLHGVVVGPATTIDTVDAVAASVVWRGVALCARSVRLASLTATGHDEVSLRSELTWAGRRAAALEVERARRTAPPGPAWSIRRHRKPSRSRVSGSQANARGHRPAIRLEVGHRAPGWKRATDLVLGLGGLAVTAPALAVGAALVRRSSPGPVLFRQVRVGTGGLPFQLYKFRTMYVGNDDAAQRAQNERELLGGAEAAKDGDDPRITPIGRWLRRLSLDELPQLLNVVRAEMSLVGPRPALLWEVELFEPSRRRRLAVQPGMTGPWQISGRGEVSMSEMLELDLDYVASISPTTDLKCLVGTARAVISGDGAR
ncbi:MAG: sugar transferase [Acidimicrobiia bacterium]|nr:sugar transferase [Acidimicrobiia bacterium]